MKGPKCIICQSNNSIYATIECKHLLYCSTCYNENINKIKEENKCPICREPCNKVFCVDYEYLTKKNIEKLTKNFNFLDNKEYIEKETKNIINKYIRDLLNSYSVEDMINKLFKIKLKEFLEQHINSKLKFEVEKFFDKFDTSLINCYLMEYYANYDTKKIDEYIKLNVKKYLNDKLDYQEIHNILYNNINVQIKKEPIEDIIRDAITEVLEKSLYEKEDASDDEVADLFN